MKQYRTDVNRAEYPRLRAMSWAYSLAAAALMVTLLFTLCFSGIQVADDGMAPTLQKGDVLLISRLSKYAAMPRRGDAYAFGRAGAQLGRIVGLPGDEIAMEDGRVYIDGCLLDESAYATLSDWNMEPRTLERGQFLILPDDRPNAIFNPDAMIVPHSELLGRAALRVSPLGRAAVFRS